MTKRVYFESEDEGLVIADTILWHRLNHESFNCIAEEYDAVDDLCQQFFNKVTVCRFMDGSKYRIESDLAAAITNGLYWTNFDD